MQTRSETVEEGSPPRGRGIVLGLVLLQEEVRITPAWAGNSGLRWWKAPQGRDHPRVGGE